MNENGLNTIELDLDVIIGLFWTKAMMLVDLSMDPMVDSDCIYGFDIYLRPLMNLIGPCPCKASLDRHKPLFVH